MYLTDVKRMDSILNGFSIIAVREIRWFCKILPSSFGTVTLAGFARVVVPIQRLSAGGAGGATSGGGVTGRGTERVSGAATLTGTVIGSAAAGAVF